MSVYEQGSYRAELCPRKIWQTIYYPLYMSACKGVVGCESQRGPSEKPDPIQSCVQLARPILALNGKGEYVTSELVF